MITTLQMLDEEFGGAEGYLRKYCNFSDADLKTIRKNLVEGNSPSL
jgi:Tyrosine phosphatase family